MADLINVHDPVSRARTLEGMGVDIIAAHVGIDQQMIGKNSLDLLKAIQGEIHIPVAVAGGLDAATAGEAVSYGADIVIVGGWIARSADVTGSTRLIRQSIDSPPFRPRKKRVWMKRFIRFLCRSLHPTSVMRCTGRAHSRD